MKMVSMRIGSLLLLTALSSCGGGAAVPVKVVFAGKSVPTSLTSVQLTVTGSDMTTISSTQSAPFSSTITFSVDVPVGNARTFTATAAIQEATSEGYQGTATANVTSEGGNVPITMLYVNFSADPATTSSGPQISTTSVLYNNSNVSFFVDFSADLDLNAIAGVLELVPDAATSFRSQSIINELKGNVDVTMPSPGSAYIIFNGTGTALTATLYNQSDVSEAATVTATLSGTSTVVLTMSQSQFNSVVDSGTVGKFNVLAGSILSPVSPLTPTNTTDFTPSSAAVGTTGGNEIIYNAAFDTTAL